MNGSEKKINFHFPNAKTIPEITSSIISRIKNEQNILPEKILLATSFCSDEINHNKYSFSHQFHCGEFILGGITGYPFSGLTGLSAYFSHIPNDGASLIIFGPHIGISRNGNIGFNTRNMQSVETPTCGALTGILEKLNSPIEWKEKQIKNYDYQVDFVTQRLNTHKKNIADTKLPIVEITKKTFSLIEKDIKEMIQSKKKDIENFPVYLLGGILINTDAGHNDFFEPLVFEQI